MASTAGKRKTTNRKNTGRAKSSRAKAPRRAVSYESPMSNEAVLLICLAAAILLFLCNFGVIGTVGNVISSVMFGLFGMMAYVTPVLLFLAIAFSMVNKGQPIAVVKLVAGVVLFFLLGIVFELVHGNLPLMDSYRVNELYESGSLDRAGGGVICGSVAYFLYHLLDMVGTVFVVLVLGIICVVVLTEKSFVGGMQRGSRKVYEIAMEENDRRRERARVRREEQALWREQQEQEKILRMDKKVSGVALDTELSKREEKISQTPDNMHEIMLEQSMQAESNPVIDFERVKVQSTTLMQNLHEVKGEEAAEVSLEPTTSVFSITPELSEIRMPEVSASWIPEEKTEPVEETVQLGTKEAKQAEIEKVWAEMPEPRTEFNLAARREKLESNPNKISDVMNEGPWTEEPETSVLEEQTVTYQEEQFVRGEASEERIRPKAVPKPESANGVDPAIAAMAEQAQQSVPKAYRLPPLSLLHKSDNRKAGDTAKQLKETAAHLQQTLATFGVKVAITDISQGPTVTRYELQPEPGVKVSKIVNLADDIKLNLAATDIRIEAPIPGKSAVGIEVPNKENAAVALRDLLESKEFQEFSSNIAFAVGKDIGGQTVVADIGKMPHMLIAGSTGSGKSVCINTIIMSILYKAHPDDVKLIMVDPKVVELSVYNGIPHLMIPVVTDPKKAAGALHWGVAEMTERYKRFADYNVRDLKGFNKKVAEMEKAGEANVPKKMPQIVIIVDELADLMMVSPGEVEESICRLAQLARAAGIHLIIATQRPSVDVITGLIKANMPSRVAFAVSSGVDSRTILDMNGAEKLLGKGDMLFYPQGYPKPARVQGAFVSDQEVSDVVAFLKNQTIGNVYREDVLEKIQSATSSGGSGGADGDLDRDEYFVDAAKFIIDKEKASIGMLQRVFKIGFNRAARIMDQLCEAGVVGEEEGTKPRKVLMSMEQFESYIEEML